MAISEAISIAPTTVPLRIPGLFDGALSAILSGILILLRAPNYPVGPDLSVRRGAQPAQIAKIRLTDSEVEFIGARDGFYMATVGENGQPYIHYRGGKPGFLKALSATTLGFAGFRGNLQYISIGTLRRTDKAVLFLMDYANRQHLKILARIEVINAPASRRHTNQMTAILVLQ
jgi:hypothetical protein